MRRDLRAMSLVEIPRHLDGERFLKGPIPWTWIERAMSLPGRALHVGLCVWLQSGIERCAIVSVNLSRLSLSRSSASRGLRALEQAGLVSVIRRGGRRPLVTLRTPDR